MLLRIKASIALDIESTIHNKHELNISMLSCQQISLEISSKKLFEISITLLPGSIVIIRGANGVGKSSLLRIFAGLQEPSAGIVLWNNALLQEAVKPFATYIGHNIGIKDELTVFENLVFWSRLYNSENMLQAAIHYFDLMDILPDKVFTLSAGNRQKIAIARLLACNADLWLLDEVETHFDERNTLLLHNAICAKANNAGIIIMTSHDALRFKQAIEINIEDFCA